MHAKTTRLTKKDLLKIISFVVLVSFASIVMIAVTPATDQAR
jgi:hypothetical protein